MEKPTAEEMVTALEQPAVISNLKNAGMEQPTACAEWKSTAQDWNIPSLFPRVLPTLLPRVFQAQK